ncbi:hypothetical protein DFS34DRAFT_592592 [Phlyctochytrium arcticum]|nr:hypothetical protein DFS34DRAFT_592592 [Phlyctochytrium arcticum]
MKCKNVEVSVLVNGVPLTEYKSEFKNNGTLAECWIIGEPETTYQVQIQTRKLTTESVSTMVFVDGRKERLGSYFMKRNDTTQFIGPRVNNGTARRPMKFGAKAHSTEDTSIGRDKEQNLAELSSIRVEVWRTRKIGYNNGPRSVFVEDTPVISEKATRKSGRFCDTMTKFGESVPVKWKRSIKTTKLDKVPWVVFKFFYGSRGVLESEDVIPVEHLPQQAADDNVEPNVILDSPDAVVRAVEDLSDDKRAQVLDDLARRFGMKRENEASGNDSRKARRIWNWAYRFVPL